MQQRLLVSQTVHVRVCLLDWVLGQIFVDLEGERAFPGASFCAEEHTACFTTPVCIDRMVIYLHRRHRFSRFKHCASAKDTAEDTHDVNVTVQRLKGKEEVRHCLLRS